MSASKKNRLSEPDSEKTKQLGRPRIIPMEVEVMLRQMHPEVTTQRGLQQVWYRNEAIVALMDYDEFKWLMDWDGMMRGDESAWKPSILSELGRLDNPETIRYVARTICERKPSTREAVALVRRIRGIEEKPGDALEISKVIGKAVVDYCKQHPGTTLNQIIEALAMQTEIVTSFQQQAELKADSVLGS